MSLYSRLDRIAADVARLDRQLTSVSNHPQSQRTSVEGGSIDFNDSDGNLKAIVGEQDDGGYTTNVVSGPTPPTPTNYTVEVDYGSLKIHWDGDFEAGAVAPTDWDHWSAYAQSGQFVVADRSTDRGGNKSASGGEVTVGVERGPWTVTLLSWSQAGKPSAMATPVTVDVPGYGDLVQETLDEAQELIDEAKAALEAGQADLAEKITDAETALSSLQSTLDDLDSTTLPALRQDLDAAEGRLTSAEGQITDAFGQIVDVRSDAAADATSKADAAKSAAVSYADGLKTQIDSTIDTARSELEGDISAAQADATQALTSANTKNKVTRSTSRPPASYDGRVDDVWFTMSSMGSGGRVLYQEMWNGTTWVSVTIDSQVIAYLDAAKITTGFLDVASLIRAGAISTDMLAVGLAGNLIYDPKFTDAAVSSVRTAGTTWSWKTSGGETFFERVMPESLTLGQMQLKDPAGSVRYIPVAPGVKQMFEIDVEGGISVFIDIRYADGSVLTPGDSIQERWSTSRRVERFVFDPDLYPSPTSDVATHISVYLRQRNRGSSNPAGAVTRVFSARLSPMTNATIIEDGGVTTPKLAANVLEVGNLKAGTAAIAEAVVAKIATQTASIQQADVKNLFVTGTSSLSNVVAERIAAETAKFIQLEVGNLVAGTGTMNTATINKLFSDVVVASMAQAQQFIGENAILTNSVTAPKIVASEELWAKLGQFVKIRAEHIQSDAFDFMVARGGTYLTSGGNGSWSDNGLFISGPDGTSLVRFPTDGTPLSLTASDVQIDRASIDELDINQQTVRSGGTVTLASGVTAPASPPESTAAWKRDVVLDKPDPGLAYDWTGLAKWGDKWVRGVNVLTAVGDDLDAIEIYNPDGTLNKSINIDLNPRAGVAVIGDIVYTIGPDHLPTNTKNWCHGFDLNTGARVSRWEFVNFYSANQAKIAVGTDGTNLIAAGVGGSPVTLYVFKYNPATGAQVGSQMTDSGWNISARELFGVHQIGSDLYITHKGSTRVYTVSGSTITRKSGSSNGTSWAGWSNPNNNTGGMTFVGDRPVLADSSSIYAGSSFTADTTVQACFTWTNGSQETTPSPIVVGSVFPRESVTISLPKREGLQKNLYLKSSQYGGNWAKTTIPVNTTSVVLDEVLAGLSGLPTQNTFPASTPAVLKSGVGNLEFRGDGSGRIGPLTFGADGSMTGIPKMAHGKIAVSVPANTTTSAAVTLPAGMFTTVPDVVVTAGSSSPYTSVQGVSVNNITTTSFDVFIRRSNADTTGIHWIAIGD